jgi:hypothetical protein
MKKKEGERRGKVGRTKIDPWAKNTHPVRNGIPFHHGTVPYTHVIPSFLRSSGGRRNCTEYSVLYLRIVSTEYIHRYDRPDAPRPTAAYPSSAWWSLPRLDSSDESHPARWMLCCHGRPGYLPHKATFVSPSPERSNRLWMCCM